MVSYYQANQQATRKFNKLFCSQLFVFLKIWKIDLNVANYNVIIMEQNELFTAYDILKYFNVTIVVVVVVVVCSMSVSIK